MENFGETARVKDIADELSRRTLRPSSGVVFYYNTFLLDNEWCLSDLRLEDDPVFYVREGKNEGESNRKEVTPNENDVRQIMETLGVPREDALTALQKTRGNRDAACNDLLEKPEPVRPLTAQPARAARASRASQSASPDGKAHRPPGHVSVRTDPRPARQDPFSILMSEFPKTEPGIVRDVLLAFKQDIEKARHYMNELNL
jgi:hypothetical protein